MAIRKCRIFSLKAAIFSLLILIVATYFWVKWTGFSEAQIVASRNQDIRRLAALTRGDAQSTFSRLALAVSPGEAERPESEGYYVFSGVGGQYYVYLSREQAEQLRRDPTKWTDVLYDPSNGIVSGGASYLMER